MADKVSEYDGTNVKSIEHTSQKTMIQWAAFIPPANMALVVLNVIPGKTDMMIAATIASNPTARIAIEYATS